MAGLTQWELAQRSGVSRMRLSLAECEQVVLHGDEEVVVRSVLATAIAAQIARAAELQNGMCRMAQTAAL
jgi:hypothetical protein